MRKKRSLSGSDKQSRTASKTADELLERFEDISYELDSVEDGLGRLQENFDEAQAEIGRKDEELETLKFQIEHWEGQAELYEELLSQARQDEEILNAEYENEATRLRGGSHILNRQNKAYHVMIKSLRSEHNERGREAPQPKTEACWQFRCSSRGDIRAAGQANGQAIRCHN